MPIPIDPPLESRRTMFLLRTWVVGGLAVGVCLAITWLHFDQEEVLQRSGQWLRSFRAARIDLAKGFLHVSLAGEPESSFRREDGLALIDQALQGLSEAEARRWEGAGERGEAMAPVGSARIAELARVLREQVGAYRQAEAGARPALELPMRLAFHDLERFAEQVDSAGQENLGRISARLNTQFAGMLGTSAVLLGLMCVGVHQVERRQRRTEDELRQSEARLRTLGDNLPGGALYQLHMRPGGPSRYTHVSAGFERIFGMPVRRILAEPQAFWALIVEDDRRRLEDEEQRCARDGTVLDVEFRQRTVHGEVKWLHARSMPRRLADGSILWDGVASDITERKAADEALKSQKATLRGVLDATRESIWLFNPEGQVLLANQTAARRLGRAPEEIAGYTLADLVPPELAASRLEHLRKVVETGRWTTFEDRREGWCFQNSFYPVFDSQGRVGCVVSFSQDISARKMHEAEIERLTRLYATLSQINQGIVRVKSRVELFQHVCSVTAKRGGFKVAWVGWREEPGETVRMVARAREDAEGVDAVHECSEDQPEACGLVAQCLRTGRPCVVEDILEVKEQEPWHRVALAQQLRSAVAFPIRLQNQIHGAFAVFDRVPGTFRVEELALLEEAAMDIEFGIQHLENENRRARAEEGLRDSEVRRSMAMDAANAGTWEWELATGRNLWSEELWKLYGIAPHSCEPSYEGWRQSVHPEDRPRLERILMDAVGREGEINMEWRVNAPGGSDRWLMARGRPMRDAAGRVARYLGVVIDITERKRLEERLRQAQKLEAIGHLAGGVAHDFNNILAAILMQIGLMQMDRTLGEESRAALGDMGQEVERAANLTRQLLMFSRRAVMSLEPLDLDQVLDNLLKMLRRLIGEHIRLELGHRTALPLVEADAGMMDQVIMNLVVNARDAMPNGGKITLTTSVSDFGEAKAAAGPNRPTGRVVSLAVTDTGHGMDAETLKRVFDPFFTTKEPGKGTGLGLATVHGIVAQHRGWVEVESTVGVGSTFRVHLPVFNGAPAEKSASAPLPPIEGGRETILVVEDQPNVRRLLSQTLRAQGYSVFEAGNGQEAVALWGRHGSRIDLLLTDMIMPEGMTGLELAARVRALKPGLKVIISSGYSHEFAQRSAIDEAGIHYLPKPYESRRLADTVRRCLEGG